MNAECLSQVSWGPGQGYCNVTKKYSKSVQYQITKENVT